DFEIWTSRPPAGAGMFRVTPTDVEPPLDTISGLSTTDATLSGLTITDAVTRSPPSRATTATVLAEVVALPVKLNVVLDEPAGTVTEAGTLPYNPHERETIVLCAAADASVTVPVAVSPGWIIALSKLRARSLRGRT